jgi:hypothetical protein
MSDEALYAPRWVTDEDMPAELVHEILPGLFMGGTDDDDVVYQPGEPTWFDDDRPYDAVVTLFAWARPVTWEVEELRYGFGDGTVELIDVDRLVRAAHWAHQRWQTGDSVLVRCQAGLNRSGLVTALVLMLDGHSAAGAIRLIRARRAPAALCNNHFVQWLLDHGDAALAAHRASSAA